MTSSHRGSRRNADQLSDETSYALLARLTIIKAQAQLLERWARRNPAPDSDMVLQRLESIDHEVGRMVEELDDVPAAPGSEDDPEASASDPGRA